jgi:type II secretory pathway pseudopilin PulG
MGVQPFILPRSSQGRLSGPGGVTSAVRKSVGKPIGKSIGKSIESGRKRVERTASPKTQSGVTLLELVIVIFLFGIIGIVALSRTMGANTFNQLIARDQIISVARIAQNVRIGRAPVSFSITPNVGGDLLAISASHDGGVFSAVTVNAADVVIRADINQSASCAATDGATLVTNANPLVFTYDALGELGVSGVMGSTGAVTSAARICINGDPAMSICVASSGYAYVGDCDG